MKKWTWKRFLKRLVISVLLLYAIVSILLFSFQEKLIFHPRALSVIQTDSISLLNPSAEKLALKMSDGKTVHGWLVKTDSSFVRPLIIYFGGNAEEISHWITKTSRFEGSSVAFINYRGYGLSEGEPGEEALFSDALEIHDQLRKRPDLIHSSVFIIGRSLGTGIATYVSSKREVKGTILITPFESMADLAQEKYPYVPVRVFLRHRFNSVEMAANIRTPVLTFIASEDVVIPPHHAEKLLEKWSGKKRTNVYREDHSSIMSNEEVYTQISRFVHELK